MYVRMIYFVADDMEVSLGSHQPTETIQEPVMS